MCQIKTNPELDKERFFFQKDYCNLKNTLILESVAPQNQTKKNIFSFIGRDKQSYQVLTRENWGSRDLDQTA